MKEEYLKFIMLVPLGLLLINFLAIGLISIRRYIHLLSTLGWFFFFGALFYLSTDTPVSQWPGNFWGKWIALQNTSLEFSSNLDGPSLLFVLLTSGLVLLMHLASWDMIKDSKRPTVASLNATILGCLVFYLSTASNVIVFFWVLPLSSILFYWQILCLGKGDDDISSAKFYIVINYMADVVILASMLMLSFSAGSMVFHDWQNEAVGEAIKSLKYRGPILGGLVSGILLKSISPYFFSRVDTSKSWDLWLVVFNVLIFNSIQCLFFFYRLSPLLSATEFFSTFCLVGGLVIGILTAALAIFQNNIFKNLIFFQLSQIGFLFMLASTNAWPLMAYFMMSIVLVMMFLFLIFGLVKQRDNSSNNFVEITKVITDWPFLFWPLLLTLVSLMYFPTTPGFWAITTLLSTALTASSMLEYCAILLFASLVVLNICKLIFQLLINPSSNGSFGHKRQSQIPPLSTTIPLVLLVVAILTIGQWAFLPWPFAPQIKLLDYFFGSEKLQLSSGATNLFINILVLELWIALLIFICYIYHFPFEKKHRFFTWQKRLVKIFSPGERNFLTVSMGNVGNKCLTWFAEHVWPELENGLWERFFLLPAKAGQLLGIIFKKINNISISVVAWCFVILFIASVFLVFCSY